MKDDKQLLLCEWNKIYKVLKENNVDNKVIKEVKKRFLFEGENNEQ